MQASRVGLLCLSCTLWPGLTTASHGQTSLPSLAPTQGATAGVTAPLAAASNPAAHPGQSPHPAQVTCANGQLVIHAENSSLNGILRSISRCTGMRITGGIQEQRVYGDYGPAAPATVLATLIDGTGTNMLLHETTADQPAELILTPRTGGPTPPSPSSYQQPDEAQDNAPAPPSGTPPPAASSLANRRQMRGPGMRGTMPMGMQSGNPNQTPVPQPTPGSAVTGPQPIPQPFNNVNGSPDNTSPTAATYPTTNSVPLDGVRTPSTTPSTNGIVDAPNPPPAGSDTAAEMNGAPKGTPGTTNISPDNTSNTSTPGATNTTVPVNGSQPANPAQGTDSPTPEQIFQQLQQRMQQEQQQQQQQNNPQ